ncbi:MAG: NAD(P)/FAD-dependent oxidoreductase, partial [Turicibacter sanguinis]
MVDILIIGCGIVGSLMAYELSKYDVKVVVVDKENDIANESTMANSAIIHAGFDPIPNTLKAKLNLLGKDLYEPLCKSLKVGYKKVGSLTVATSEEEVKKLEILESRAKENKVKVRLISGDEVRVLEPQLSTNIVKGLVCEETAIVYPWEVAIAAMEVALNNGVELQLNTEVLAIHKGDNYEVQTSNGMIQAKMVINAAGLFGCEVGRMINP